MYAIDIICSNGHTFESWFQNRKAFEEQLAGSVVSCPFCGDVNVKQVLSPVRIGKHAAADKEAAAKLETEAKVKAVEGIKAEVRSKVLEVIEKQFEDVGKEFPEEARKIHYGEADARNIRGSATPEEEKELATEGVPFVKIPNFQ